MKTKQIVFTAPGCAEYVERELGELGEEEVLVRTLYSLVSQGTEKAFLRADPNAGKTFPKSLGYCAVSRVVETGSAVCTCRAGDRVLVYHGFHASYVKVHETQLLKIEDERIDDRDAAFVIVAAMGLGGLRRLAVELGESVAIFGMGLLGITALQFARLSGACPLVAFDLNPNRRALARSLGADDTLSPAEEGYADRAKYLTDGGFHAVVEGTGVGAALDNALDVTRPGGRVSLLGCTRVAHPLDFYNKVHRPGVILLGAHNMARPQFDSRPHVWTNFDDMRAILRLLSYRRISFLPLIGQVRVPEECSAFYRELLAGTDDVGVLFDWRQA